MRVEVRKWSSSSPVNSLVDCPPGNISGSISDDEGSGHTAPGTGYSTYKSFYSKVAAKDPALSNGSDEVSRNIESEELAVRVGLRSAQAAISPTGTRPSWR